MAADQNTAIPGLRVLSELDHALSCQTYFLASHLPTNLMVKLDSPTGGVGPMLRELDDARQPDHGAERLLPEDMREVHLPRRTCDALLL
jgi:hypothetical protein